MTKSTIRVKSTSDVKALAGSITKSLEEGNVVEVQSIGASAVNQAVKAIAMSRGFIAPKGKDLIVRPGFGETTIDGKEKTVMLQFVSII